MLGSSNKWRGEMMRKGGDDSLKTVESLRGRLLAERAASKAAKDEAELLAERLTDLERKLAEEIKHRDKAEKRLKNALKKLESLKLLDVSSQLNLSGSSVSSSSVCFSDYQTPGGRKPDSQVTNSEQCGSIGEVDEKVELSGSEDLGYSCSDDSSARLSGQLVSHEWSWSSVGTAHSNNKDGPHSEDGGKSQGLVLARQSLVGNEKLDSQQQQSECEDNSLALVPTSMWPSSGGCKPEIRNHVQGVLLALRHVKEQLQSSIGRSAVVSSPKELYGQ